MKINPNNTIDTRTEQVCRLINIIKNIQKIKNIECIYF